MVTSTFISSLGYILKKEKLASLTTRKNYPELILEDLDPYPGFYDHYFVPANEKEKKPRSIFLVVKEFDLCNEDKFIRMTMHIKRSHSINFNAAMAVLELFNKPAPSIRVFMEDYEQLDELISHYRQAGLHFQPYRVVKPFQTLIEVRKFFEMEEIGDGIFKDLDQVGNFYLIVPEFLAWDDFEHITSIIRNNLEYKSFDAAQAAIYEKKGIIELIRIYDKQAKPEHLALLRQKYLWEFERL